MTKMNFDTANSNNNSNTSISFNDARNTFLNVLYITADRNDYCWYEMTFYFLKKYLNNECTLDRIDLDSSEMNFMQRFYEDEYLKEFIFWMEMSFIFKSSITT